MKKAFLLVSMALVCSGVLLPAKAQVSLIANGKLTTSRAGLYKDLSGLNYTLENGAPANLLGGLGSGIAYLSGDTFLALPDRGPNAIPYNSLIDDTASYIPRVHTIHMNLEKNHGGGLPFTIAPRLEETTLLWACLPSSTGTAQPITSLPALLRSIASSNTTSRAVPITSTRTVALATCTTPVWIPSRFASRMMA